MGQLKRKNPNEVFPDKVCPWCGKVIKRTRQCMSEWNRIKHCSSRCATLFKNNGCSEKEYQPLIKIRYCAVPSCSKLMIRGDTETLSNWEKRQTCNRSCASKHKALKPKKAIKTLEQRFHVITYTPGSPEFIAIAALYK